MKKTSGGFTSGKVVWWFAYGGPDGLTKRDLIRLAGEILLMKDGRDRLAEFFLRGFLTINPADPRSYWALALNGLNNWARSFQINEVREDCFAFLSACRPSNLTLETRLVLDELTANPPYPEFLDNARGKMDELTQTKKGVEYALANVANARAAESARQG